MGPSTGRFHVDAQQSATQPVPRPGNCVVGAAGVEPELLMLDVTDAQRPRARPLSAALARIVRGRAVDERFIAGQMRHGPRGAAEPRDSSAVGEVQCH